MTLFASIIYNFIYFIYNIVDISSFDSAHGRRGITTYQLVVSIGRSRRRTRALSGRADDAATFTGK